MDSKTNVKFFGKRKFSWKRLFLAGVGIVVLFILAAIIFIHFNTEAAANFTDDVLRPLLGSNNVIAMEQIYFNSEDKVNQFLSIFKTEKSPLTNSGNILSPSSLHVDNGTLDLKPLTSNTKIILSREGEWQNIPLSLFPNQVVMADTFIRPDPARPYAFVTIVQMDMSKVRLSSVAGTIEPGGKAGKPGPGVIPKDIQNQGNLIAAFDGGFQYRDGQYGMIVGKETYLPLKNDLATLVGHADGRIEIVKYEGQNLGNDVVFVRQNCPMLVENGVVEANDSANRKLWGRTTTGEIYTWRSGIGITAQGNLIFAIGNSLVSDTLASALKTAGAVSAMQLDINPNWVRFNIFNNYFNGQYSSQPVMAGIKDGAYEYLNGDKKDFFYLTKKT
jgi:hypothetical protein